MRMQGNVGYPKWESIYQTNALVLHDQKRNRKTYLLVAILLPPQNTTVAVQLLSGVNGNIMLPALAG